MISFLLTVRQPIRVFFVVAYLGLIVALSLLPPNDLPQIQLFRGADKVIHTMMYLGFSLLSCWTLRIEKHLSRTVIIILISIGWGVLMEYIQRAMHMGRSFSVYDILANILGVFTGVIFYYLVTRKFES